MKKILACVLAAATVLSLSVTSFAALASVYENVVDGDGDSISFAKGASKDDDVALGNGSYGEGTFDTITPDQTFYIGLGKTNLSDYVATSDASINLGTNINFPAAYLADNDLFSMSTKDKSGDASKLIKIYQEDSKTIDGVRGDWLKVVVGNTMTSSELKGTMTLEFKPKSDLYEEIYSFYKKGKNYNAFIDALNTTLGAGTLEYTSDQDAVEDALDEVFDGCKYKIDLTFWVNNTIEDGSDADMDAGDAFVFNPESNEENTIIWNTEKGERAALKFDADDDADKFYAKLSVKSNSSIYAEYGDPVGADLWFYDFVGATSIPATSRATLTLGIPWDEDDDYVPASPEDCYIYRLNSDGTLEDVTNSFTYDSEGTIDGWYTRTRELGTFIVSDMELDIEVAGAEEVVDPDDTTTPDKEIPNTGSSDMVNVAVAAAVVSLAAAGAVAFRKVK